MHDIIEQLQERSETVPVPLELPTFEQLVEVEEQILIPLPRELKEYLLHASDVIYGAIEPVTAADPYSHTYLPEVTCYAQLGDDFYCIDQDGQVHFWQNGDFTDTYWESFWEWVEDIWLKNKY